MIAALAVGIGGAIGAMARYGVNVFSARAFGVAFPYGTLGINVIGCFIMGVVVALFALREPVDPMLKLFLTTGILGGFTTFSAVSLETVMLFDRKPVLAGIYALASVVLSVAGCWAGLRAVKWMTA